MTRTILPPRLHWRMAASTQWSKIFFTIRSVRRSWPYPVDADANPTRPAASWKCDSKALYQHGSNLRFASTISSAIGGLLARWLYQKERLCSGSKKMCTRDVYLTAQ